jgi:ankyrin repeat protein
MKTPFALAVIVVTGLIAPAARAAQKPGEDLIKAAKKGDVAKLRALLQQGVPVDTQDGDGKTPLWEAARHDKADVVAVLIEAKANLNLPDKDGATPLLVAASRDDSKVLSMLLSAGADTTVRGPSGVTLLMAASSGGHTDLIGKLLQTGGKVNEEDASGETALHYAARQGRGQTIRALVDAHGDVDHPSHAGMTPLMLAAAGGRSDAVDALLGAGAHPNISNTRDKGWTAIMYAAGSNSATSTVIDSLGSHGALVNVQDTAGDQPIHVAARAGQTALVGALIDHGAHVNERGGPDRRSPLEIAVERDDRGTAEMLLDHHACVTGQARDTAAKKKSEKMVALLESHSKDACNVP